MTIEDTLSEIVDDTSENRKNHAQKLTVEKLPKIDRQKHVYLMHIQGYQNKEIADTLGPSLSTIEKDLHEIRESANTWFVEISKSGMAKSLIDSFLQIDEAQKELWQLYRTTGFTKTKVKILTSIADLALKKKAIFWGTKQDPYYHGYGISDTSNLDFDSNLTSK